MASSTADLHLLKTPAQSAYASSLYNISSGDNGFYEQSVSKFDSDRTVEPPALQRRMKCSRLVGEYEKPWTVNSPYKGRERWDKIILWGCITAGVGFGTLLCWAQYASVPKHEYCLILDDKFENLDNWSYETQTGGFGTGAFDWTSNDLANSYVSNNQLHIIPTLTTDTTNITVDQLLSGYSVNLTTTGVCTSTVSTDCVISSNSTTGAIINPVRSARLTTKGKHSITYGRVEVVAKMPRGDWLWPAIWMMPVSPTYGAWPRSGEIDILESRGNDGGSYSDGSDTASSSLHWGLDSITDMYWQTTSKHYARRTDYTKDFHTFGLEWSENYLYTYIDNRLLQVVSVAFGSSGGDMWSRGGFEAQGLTDDPWSQTGRYNTPFDQPFYLILNVAVGGTNGYFGDSIGKKPWVDASSTTAARSFWKAKSSWLPTWGVGEERGMTIKSVKMWQQGACS